MNLTQLSLHLNQFKFAELFFQRIFAYILCKLITLKFSKIFFFFFKLDYINRLSKSKTIFKQNPLLALDNDL